MSRKAFYLEWGVERKKNEMIVITEMSGNAIRQGFVFKENAL